MNRRFVLLMQSVCLLALPIAAFSQWQPNGNPIAVASNDQDGKVMCYDGSGGTVVAWVDDYSKIYAQHFDATGAAQWAVNGVEVTTHAVSLKADLSICPDGLGGAFITWTDDRNELFNINDIYAQHLSSAGAMLWDPAGLPICTLARNQTGLGLFGRSCTLL